jgi:hypothetical protein
MAFTEAEKVQIRKWLGWSDRFLQVDSALERAMQAVGDRVDSATEVRAVLAEIQTIKAEIVSARRRLKAHAVGTILLTGEGEIDTLRGVGMTLSKQLATMFGVETRTNPWFPGSVHHRVGWDGPSGGGGEMPFG